MKHLLLLKQQIVAFDIEFVTPEVDFDFSHVMSTFWELRERGGLFNPATWYKLVGSGLVPRVVENMLDAKVELDGKLRTVINDFTNSFAIRMTTAISGVALTKQGTRFDAFPATKVVREEIEKQTPFLRRKLDEYLDDIRTKETLVGAVQDQVVQSYEDFYQKQISNGTNGRLGSKKGKGREDEIWDPDMFADWCQDVFKVGGLGLGLGLDMAGQDDEQALSGSEGSGAASP